MPSPPGLAAAPALALTPPPSHLPLSQDLPGARLSLTHEGALIRQTASPNTVALSSLPSGHLGSQLTQRHSLHLSLVSSHSLTPTLQFQADLASGQSIQGSFNVSAS